LRRSVRLEEQQMGVDGRMTPHSQSLLPDALLRLLHHPQREFAGFSRRVDGARVDRVVRRRLQLHLLFLFPQGFPAICYTDMCIELQEFSFLTLS